MIDIHCHILADLDDGAKDLRDSLEMAKAAVHEGIHTIIATPHYKNGRYENNKQTILEKVDELNSALRKEGISVTVLPGQEPRIYGEFLEDYRKGEILTLNDGNQYVFIELPSGDVPRYTEQLLFDIQLEGLIPIIVHPERNQAFLERPELLYQYVKKGALTQITAASVAGYSGKKISRFSLQLIDANLTHFVSSDAHNTTNRAFKMAEAFEIIEKKYNMNTVYMFKENAELLVQGKNVYKEAPNRVQTKSFFRFF